MSYAYNGAYTPLARTLRKNMTDEEKHLWYDFLCNLPVTVNRQKNIDNFIVDFYVAKKHLAIEIDGRQHGEPENREADRARDEALYALGVTVVRYTNDDIIHRFRWVCTDLLARLQIEPSAVLWTTAP